MVEHDGFDPRVGMDYPSDLLENTRLKDNLTNRRLVSGVGNSRNEFLEGKG